MKRPLLTLFGLGMAFLGTQEARAVLPLEAGIPQLSSFLAQNPYQIGDTWDRVPFAASSIDQVPDSARNLILSTAKFNGGTAFYLGQYLGQHLMATNHHVLEGDCPSFSKKGNFVALNAKFTCEFSLGSWRDLDLNLFVVTLDEVAEEQLEGKGIEFDFGNAPVHGEPLVTAGYGAQGGFAQRFSYTIADECRVLSATGDVRFIPDPDKVNPGEGNRWSFVTGCEVSHGDSGSALVSLETGKAVGLIWTGVIPRPEKFYDQNFINELIRTPNEEAWEGLNFGVAASKISEVLQDVLDDGGFEDEHADIVNALLQGNRDR